MFFFLSSLLSFSLTTMAIKSKKEQTNNQNLDNKSHTNNIITQQ